MAWYDKGNSALDFTKPIKATHTDGSVYLLMPVRDTAYAVTYEWFNPISGYWNSSKGWKNPNDPVECYKQMGYKVTNTTITLS